MGGATRGRRVKHQWYCRVDGEQYGPFTWEQMRAMADEGRLVANTHIRREVDQKWFLAGQVSGLLSKPPPPTAPAKAPRQSAKPAKSASSSSIHIAASPRPPAAGASSSKLKRARPMSAGPPPMASGVRPAAQSAATPSLPIVSAAAHSDKQATSHGEAPASGRQGPNVLMIGGIVAGVLLLVGAVGVGLLAWGFVAARQAAEATLAEAAADLETELASEEGNPAAAQTMVATTTLAASPARRAGDGQALAGRMKAQARWLDVTQIRGVRLSKMRLSVGRAWLASDATGTPVVPKLQTNSAECPTAEAADAKYVFVELHIDNEAPVPRKYTSWNTGGPRSVALADQTNALLDVVAPSQTPAISRLTEVDLSPGQSATDVLVFAAPAGAIETLHLLLEKKLLAEGGRDYFAFEIPLEALMEPRGEAAAATMPTVAGPASQPTADSVAAQGEAPPAKKGGPPTKEELDRQFQALEREAKEALPAAPPEAEPAGDASDPPAQP
jgi:hypothetical protein